METPAIDKKRLNTALIQFIFPFSVLPGTQAAFAAKLREDGYRMFFLNDLDAQDAYYGQGYRVSHRNLERYYLPFTSSVLFPHEANKESFQRYSRAMDFDCVLKTKFLNIPFKIHSADLTLCPFDLGFITVRTEITKSDLTFTEAVEFADRFRVLENVSERDDKTFVLYGDREYPQIEHFLFKAVAAHTLPFLDKSGLSGAYFETLPFFVDERMYVEAFYAFEGDEHMDEADLFRAAKIDGMDAAGKPFISAGNLTYIREFCSKHSYDRWAPDTYYVMDDNAFCCLTRATGEHAVKLAGQMYGEYYYGLMLNLFHKIVLLKLSEHYSRVRLEHSQDQVENLIRMITAFSAKYFFMELASQSQGREIIVLMRTLFGNLVLYDDVKQTLNALFKYQETYSSRRTGYLLMILTIYTVISGIYGMNQVIEDLKNPIKWEKVAGYSPFEYVALAVTFSGIVVSTGLGIYVLFRWGKAQWRKREATMRR